MRLTWNGAPPVRLLTSRTVSRSRPGSMSAAPIAPMPRRPPREGLDHWIFHCWLVRAGVLQSNCCSLPSGLMVTHWLLCRKMSR
ncbi:hypothetical protein SAMN05421869_119114 [Nonomuraea jiangxiensis]|uniref:Uncharacterized protein n=1 Tax=Nonomuraea jiangxiensis TaxID=633440 RepID=A0A1G9F5L7_9ACTN|nr:hypothetical protein SAMN05421869_119114 [Nonomuraea jiangxiensis]